MTLERDVMVETEAVPAPDERQAPAPREDRLRRLGEGPFAGTEMFEAPVGRVVTFRFMRSALRRRRRVWALLAVLGLVVGVALSAFFPPKYLARATLYLAHPTGANGAVDAQNDLAMLGTVAVGQRALAHLDGAHLTPMELLGKNPGQLTSDDVLTISISGPSPQQAAARVDAVAQAYLAFRAEQYGAENEAIVANARAQIGRLTTKVKELTGRIDTLQVAGASQTLTTLVDQRAADTAQINTLHQAAQQATLASLLVAKGSRVITPGTVVPKSKSLGMLRNALIGLLVGLAAGIGGVLVYESLSDRIRRREDVAAVLGSPVRLSVPRLRGRLPGRRSTTAMVARPPAAVQMLAQYLKDSLKAGGIRSTQLVVAVGDTRIPAAAIAVLCQRLAAEGEEVVVVDSSDRRLLARTLESPTTGTRTIEIGGASAVTLVVPGAPWEDDGWPESRNVRSETGARLVLATLDLGIGAEHLRAWSSEAIVAVPAGGATAERIDAVSRLLRAAGITVSSAVLLDADRGDETVGIPEGGPVLSDRPLAPFTAATQP